MIVGIDDDDYKNIFGSIRPLAPQKVTEIINAISKGNPKVLGIDILTSDEIHKEYALNNAIFSNTPFPIVWADEPKIENGEIKEVLPPLNGKLLPQKNFSGVPAVPKDEDETNHLYQRSIELKRELRPTFAWQIYKLGFPEEAAKESEDTQEFYIRFAGESQQDERLTISASQVLNNSKSGNLEELQNFFQDKIVLLGGMFSDSNDFSKVPYGNIYGVELNATIIETEIHRNPHKPISGILKFILNIIAFPFLAFIFHHYKLYDQNKFSLKPLIIVIIISGIVTIISSISLYGNFAGVPFIISIFIGALILALFDKLMDYWKETGSDLISKFLEKIKSPK